MADLITASQFRDFYPGLQGTGDDALCLRLIGYADAALAIWCGNPPTSTLLYTWTPASYDLRFDGPLEVEPRVIDLETKVFSPSAAALTAVYSDPTWAFTSAMPATDYLLDKSRGWVILTPSSTSVWSASPLSNRVVATGGFGTTPPEVIQATSLTVKAILEGGTRPDGFTSLSAGGRSVTRSEASRMVPRAAMDLMSPWRGPAGG